MQTLVSLESLHYFPVYEPTAFHIGPVAVMVYWIVANYEVVDTVRAADSYPVVAAVKLVDDAVNVVVVAVVKVEILTPVYWAESFELVVSVDLNSADYTFHQLVPDHFERFQISVVLSVYALHKHSDYECAAHRRVRRSDLFVLNVVYAENGTSENPKNERIQYKKFQFQSVPRKFREQN